VRQQPTARRKGQQMEYMVGQRREGKMMKWSMAIQSYDEDEADEKAEV